MRITLDEFLEAMNRARDEERSRASSILAERDQALIRRIGAFRKLIIDTWDESLDKRRDVLTFLDSLDPRPSSPPGTSAEYAEVIRKRYPTMFKGGPT